MQNDRQFKPESLEAKFKLLQLLPYDARAKRKHCLVFGFILDWYHSKYGDALASVRHIVNTTKERDPSGKGLYSGNVHQALSDLVSWGYLEQEKCIGRRASRYVPIWEKLSSVHKTPNTTENEISVRENTNTCVRENTYTTDISVRDSMNEDPSTSTRVQDPETRVDGINDCSLAAVGLVATAQAQEKEGKPFDTLYNAYGVRKKRAEAKLVFDSIADDLDFYELIASATAWREAWAAQNKPDAPRKHLHTWLRDECFLEDAPTAYRPKPQPNGSNPARGAKKLGFANDNSLPRLGMRVVDIIDTDVLTADNGDMVLYMTLCERDKPESWQREIVLQSNNPQIQATGQEEFGELCYVLNLSNIQDSSELDGKAMTITTQPNGGVVYSPAQEAA